MKVYFCWTRSVSNPNPSPQIWYADPRSSDAHREWSKTNEVLQVHEITVEDINNVFIHDLANKYPYINNLEIQDGT